MFLRCSYFLAKSEADVLTNSVLRQNTACSSPQLVFSLLVPQEHKGKEFYDGLVNHMTSGETLFMVLEREDAVDGWRHLIGPTDPSTAKEELPER